MGRRSLLALAVAMAAWAAAPAGTIYVNNLSGDDRANGRSPEIRSGRDGPVRTIGHALRIAQSSDSIVVAATGIPYTESVILDRPDLHGTPRFPLVIEGNGAVLRGAATLPSHVWRYVGGGIYRYQPYRKGHYQLLLNGSPAEEVRVERSRTRLPALKPLQWCAVRGWVYFRVEPRHFIDQYQIEVPQFDIGLGLHNARHVTVRNLKIEYFRLDGVHVSGNSRGVRLELISSTGNGRAGLAVSGTSQVTAAGLDLAGNRIADRLVLMKAHLTELPPPKAPSVKTGWLLEPGRAIRLRFLPDGRTTLVTARPEAAGFGQR